MEKKTTIGIRRNKIHAIKQKAQSILCHLDQQEWDGKYLKQSKDIELGNSEILMRYKFYFLYLLNTSGQITDKFSNLIHNTLKNIYFRICLFVIDTLHKTLYFLFSIRNQDSPMD